MAAVSGHAAIFGVDDRRDVPGESTAVAVLSANFSRNANGTIDLSPDSMSDVMCSDEKFADDPSLSYSCTAFLVAPDVLVTAGHCMVNVGESRNETASYCEAYSFLFDYQKGAPVKGIDANKLYNCKKIIYAIHEEHAPYRDYAVVQLDRPVTDRKPYKMNDAAVSISEPVSMIGYPFGAPAKLSMNAHVMLNSVTEQSFITNLDAFEGNSGSPVFNAAHEVIGILVGGTPIESLRQDNVKSCSRYNICDDDGANCLLPDKDTSVIPGFQTTGSIVQRIEPVLGVIGP